MDAENDYQYLTKLFNRTIHTAFTIVIWTLFCKQAQQREKLFTSAAPNLIIRILTWYLLAIVPYEWFITTLWPHTLSYDTNNTVTVSVFWIIIALAPFNKIYSQLQKPDRLLELQTSGIPKQETIVV